MTNKSVNLDILFIFAPFKFFLVFTVVFFGIFYSNNSVSEENKESPEKIISEIICSSKPY